MMFLHIFESPGWIVRIYFGTNVLFLDPIVIITFNGHNMRAWSPFQAYNLYFSVPRYQTTFRWVRNTKQAHFNQVINCLKVYNRILEVDAIIYFHQPQFQLIVRISSIESIVQVKTSFFVYQVSSSVKIVVQSIAIQL